MITAPSHLSFEKCVALTVKSRVENSNFNSSNTGSLEG